jgi:hypothetical protein
LLALADDDLLHVGEDFLSGAGNIHGGTTRFVGFGHGAFSRIDDFRLMIDDSEDAFSIINHQSEIINF